MIPDADFKSDKDLAQLLIYISSRMHYINRVSRESHFLAEFADLIRAAGKLADLLPDKGIETEFGTGWTKGTLDANARKARILQLLSDRMK